MMISHEVQKSPCALNHSREAKTLSVVMLPLANTKPAKVNQPVNQMRGLPSRHSENPREAVNFADGGECIFFLLLFSQMLVPVPDSFQNPVVGPQHPRNLPTVICK